MKTWLSFAFCVVAFSVNATGQTITDLPVLTQVDPTIFVLSFHTDSAAVISVHASEDTSYYSAFIFLGKTVGNEHLAKIELNGLRNNATYFYRVFLGTGLTKVSGAFTTGSSVKN